MRRRFRGWTVFLCFMFFLNGWLMGQGTAQAMPQEGASRTVYVKTRGGDVPPYRVVFKKSCWPLNEDQIGFGLHVVSYDSERIVFGCWGY